jgi:ABC-type glycerol-3-phosphate transport system permease component
LDGWESPLPAASVVTTIPVILLFNFPSKYLIGGLIAGAGTG